MPLCIKLEQVKMGQSLPFTNVLHQIHCNADDSWCGGCHQYPFQVFSYPNSPTRPHVKDLLLEKASRLRATH